MSPELRKSFPYTLALSRFRVPLVGILEVSDDLFVWIMDSSFLHCWWWVTYITNLPRLGMQSSPLYEPTHIWTLGLFLMLPQSGQRYRSWLLRSAPYAVSRAAEGPDDVMLSTQQRALMISASAEPSKSPSSSSSHHSFFLAIPAKNKIK